MNAPESKITEIQNQLSDNYVDHKQDGTLLIVIDKKDKANFIKLIRRGLNTYDNAPPNIKALGDMIEFDRVTQNYWEQDSSDKKEIKTITSISGTVCSNCKTVTTCLEQGCGQGYQFTK